MTPNTSNTRLSAADWRSLSLLREINTGDYDRFSARELERLSFIRWLVRRGRLGS